MGGCWHRSRMPRHDARPSASRRLPCRWHRCCCLVTAPHAPIRRRLLSGQDHRASSPAPRPAVTTPPPVRCAILGRHLRRQSDRHRAEHAGRRRHGRDQLSLHCAKRDGTMLGMPAQHCAVEPLLKLLARRQQRQIRPGQFAWIGGRSRDDFLCVVWHTAPVNSIADVMTRQIRGRRDRAGLAQRQPIRRLLNDLVGTKFKIVSGYPGGNEITLAPQKRRGRGLLRSGQSAASANARRNGCTTARSRCCRSSPLASRRSARRAGCDRSGDVRRGPQGHRGPVGRKFRPGMAAAWRRRTCRRSASPRIAHRIRCHDAGRGAARDAKKASLDIDCRERHRMQALIDRLYAAPATGARPVPQINAGKSCCTVMPARGGHPVITTLSA